MKGLQLKIGDDGKAEIAPRTIADADCVLQNSVVNLLTVKGSDATFPDRGADILLSGLRNVIFDSTSAQHVANFAALSTVTFMREHEYPEEIARTIDALRLSLTEIQPGYLRFSLTHTFTNGQTFSQTLTSN